MSVMHSHAPFVLEGLKAYGGI